MLYGIDEENIRVKATKTGQRAKCPYCGNTLISKCGEIYCNHWQHKPGSDCDPWANGESEWHRAWKMKFPSEWQEVIIEKNGERHIADIRTKDGTVIEFQNSPIQTFTIHERENFYQNMIWVVNADEFKDNFCKYSYVKDQLNNLDSERTIIDLINNKYNTDQKNLIIQIDSVKNEIIKKNQKIQKSIEFANKVEIMIDNIVELTNKITTEWNNNNFFHDSILFDILKTLESDYKYKWVNCLDNIKCVTKKICESKSIIKELNTLKVYNYNDIRYHLVEYFNVPKFEYGSGIAILKETKDSLFAEVIPITNNEELSKFSFIQDKYIFGIDLNSKFTFELENISNLTLELQALRDSQSVLLNEIMEKLINWLKKMLAENTNERNNLDAEIKNSLSKIQKFESQLSRFLESKKQEIENEVNRLKKEKNQLRSQIMNDYKGLYLFKWKNERKSWRNSNSTIYFDFGDGTLYERVTFFLLRKFSVEKFLREYCE